MGVEGPEITEILQCRNNSSTSRFCTGIICSAKSDSSVNVIKIRPEKIFFAEARVNDSSVPNNRLGEPSDIRTLVNRVHNSSSFISRSQEVLQKKLKIR